MHKITLIEIEMFSWWRNIYLDYFKKGHIMVKNIVIGLVASSLFIGSSLLACGPKSHKMCQHPRGMHVQKNLVPQVVKAVSKTGLSAAQTQKIAVGISQYKATIAQINSMEIFPIDSFMEDDFNATRFISERSEKSLSKIAADAALFKYVFTVLTPQQRLLFKNAYAAPVIEKMIKLHY